MQFIRIQGIIDDPAFVEANESRDTCRKNSQLISIKTFEFNEKFDKDGYIFISNIDGVIIAFGAIVEGSFEFEKNLNKFIKKIGIKIKDINSLEVTFNTIHNMLSHAARNYFIDDDDDILERFGLDRINSRFGRNIDFGENLLADITEEDIIEKASKYLAKETLMPELERIFSAKAKTGQYGHPVHYLVETDDLDLRKTFYRMILQGLRLTGRLKCKRYSYVDIALSGDFYKNTFESLYKTSFGGAIAIRINASETEEGEHASAGRDVISSICEIMKKYRNQVLTIFCFPRECTKLKEMFYEELGNICFIEIKEDFAAENDAKAFLKMLAKENHIRSDKALFGKIEEKQGYLSNELHDIFDEWYDAKLRNSVYPQYKESKTVKTEYQKTKPKGSAFDELEGMIGIVEAKSVINQALSFYKAQKLFKEKGIGEDHLAMHMCFTGSPGTAKTTCARLFAQIMKDNGLLSKGHLVELTAMDLKGKYVGWTGPQVKKAFEKAKGGVLFLDEVYSLVEDRNGSFGDEAIAAIVAEMENHRDEVVCIFAGYKDKTEQFLRKNPGLRSRIAFHVPFADYSIDELCEISKNIAKKKNRKLSSDALIKLRGYYEKAKKQDDFGNGRFCRNVIEKAKLAQATRLVEMEYDSVTKEDIELIKAEDIVLVEDDRHERKQIGFCA